MMAIRFKEPAKSKKDRLMALMADVLKAVQTEETHPTVAMINELHTAVRKNAFGRPKSGKIIVTLRLDPDVLKALKAAGAGWQPRANALLRKALSL